MEENQGAQTAVSQRLPITEYGREALLDHPAITQLAS